jgi:hypothetical protein
VVQEPNGRALVSFLKGVARRYPDRTGVIRSGQTRSGDVSMDMAAAVQQPRAGNDGVTPRTEGPTTPDPGSAAHQRSKHVFLAHAESEKRFTSQVKDATDVLSKSRRVQGAGKDRLGLPPILFLDKDAFSPGRDNSLRSFSDKAAAADVLVLIVPEGGFNPRSFVAKEILAFLTGICHASREEGYPDALGDDEIARADRRSGFLIIVDRHGTVSWPADASGPTGLPVVCRSGLLRRWFERERPRLRESSSAAQDVAAAILASVWSTEPSRIRSRVTERNRRITAGVVAVVMGVIAVLFVAIYARALSEGRRRQLAVDEAIVTAADALRESNAAASVPALLQILREVDDDPPTRAAAMSAFLHHAPALPRRLGDIGAVAVVVFTRDARRAVVRRHSGSIESYEIVPAVRRLPSPEVGSFGNELERINILEGPNASPRLSEDGRWAAIAFPLTHSAHPVQPTDWRLVAWQVGSAEIRVEATIPALSPFHGPLLWWGEGPTLLAESWDAGAKRSAATLRGWRFGPGGPLSKSPFVLSADRPFERLPAPLSRVVRKSGSGADELLRLELLVPGTRYEGDALPLGATTACTEESCPKSSSTRHYSAAPPWREVVEVSAEFLEVRPVTVENYFARRQALTRQFFGENGSRDGTWYEGRTAELLVGLGSGVIEADLKRLLLLPRRAVAFKRTATALDENRRSAIAVTPAGLIYRLPLLLERRTAAVGNGDASKGSRIPRPGERSRVEFCRDRFGQATLSRDGSLILLPTPSGFAIHKATTACELVTELPIEADDWPSLRAVGFAFEAADTVRTPNAGEILASFGAAIWHVTATRSGVSIAIGDRSLAFPPPVGWQSYLDVSNDGLRLLTKTGDSDYLPSCFQVWYLGAPRALVIAGPICLGEGTAALSPDGGELLLQPEKAPTIRVDIGPTVAARWKWATPENFSSIVATSKSERRVTMTDLRAALRSAAAGSDSSAARALSILDAEGPE